MPVFVVAHQNAQNVPEIVSDELPSSVTNQVERIFVQRWLGAGTRVGLRHVAHCLAFKLDLYTASIVKHACGEAMLTACAASFNERHVLDAIFNHCGGQRNQKYAAILAEYQLFAGLTEPYGVKYEGVDVAVKCAAAYFYCVCCAHFEYKKTLSFEE